jgi:hypothetical protein
MIQYYHNYYYNNNAGVLFTTEEMNNLRECSTVPSNPNFCSGGVTIQGSKVRNAQINT